MCFISSRRTVNADMVPLLSLKNLAKRVQIAGSALNKTSRKKVCGGNGNVKRIIGRENVSDLSGNTR